MPFEDLRQMSLERYIEINKDPNAKWIFMHIPKTAGSSFSEAMQKFLPPYKNIEVDYADNTKSHNEKISNSVDSFISSYKSINYKSASGHIPYNLVEKITHEIPDCKLVTYLRDPIKRVISDYRYQRTPQHPPYLQFIEKFPTIESFIKYEPAANKLTKFICGLNKNSDAENAIEILDKKFTFVGLVEMYPFSYNSMFKLFGCDDQLPTSHSRKTPDTPTTKIDINEDIISLIKERNVDDISVFEHVRNTLMPIREHWANSISGQGNF